MITIDVKKTNTIHKINLGTDQFIPLSYTFWPCRAIFKENN